MRTDDAMPMILGLLAGIFILLAGLSLHQDDPATPAPTPTVTATVEPIADVAAPENLPLVEEAIQVFPIVMLAFVVLVFALFVFRSASRLLRYLLPSSTSTQVGHEPPDHSARHDDPPETSSKSR